MPVTHEKKTLTVKLIDLLLFRATVGLVEVARTAIGSSRSSGEFQENVLAVDSREELTTGFSGVAAHLAIACKGSKNCRLDHEALSGFANGENKG
jgi:hypothetical protein